MVRLDEHIYNLLQTNNCVIVPEFGGFLANYRPAKLYPHRHVIYPPGKTIAFNSNLSSSDGLLVSEVSRRSKSPYREAERAVAEAVNDWQQRLEEGRPVEISRIGRITRSHEGKLLFKPEDNDLQLSSFGLDAVQALPLKQEKQVKILHMEQPITQPTQPRRQIRYSGVSIVAALLFVMVMINASFLYIADENYKQTLAGIAPAFQSIKEQLFSSGDKNEPIVAAPAEEEQEEEDEEVVPPSDEPIDTTSLAATEDIVVPPAVAHVEPTPAEEKSSQTYTAPINSGVTHYIIGGSFKGYENAEKFADKVKGSGYVPEIIGTDIGYFRVCYAKFNVEEKANKELEKIQSNINQNAWILSE